MLKSKKVIIGLVAILIIGSVLFFGGEKTKQLVVVERGEIIQEVAATGKVKPNQSVDLGFDKSGRVGAVYVSVGDFVRAGETIASLEAGEASSDIARARAVLSEEMLRLGEIENSSPRSYEDAQRSLEVAIRDAFLTSDNAIRNKVDQFFKGVPENPRFEVKFTDGNFIHYFPMPSEKTISLNNERKSVENILKAWNVSKNGTSTDVYSETERAISDMKKILSFLDNVASAMNSFTPANFEYETTVNGYKTSISNARSETSASLSALISSRDKLNSAPQLDSQSGEYKDVLIQRAKVDQARSSLASLESTFGKSLIRAPFDGVVTLQDAKVGAAVSPGETLVSMTSNQDMYIEANISEINIGKLSVGNLVSIKFDAFPGEEFRGVVSFIEPGDVLIEGVVNYKIRVNLVGGATTTETEISPIAPRIKNGLTADLKIESSKISDALALPLYAITKEGGKSFVNKVVNGKPERVEIELGREGSDGKVEVINGLNEGDSIEF